MTRVTTRLRGADHDTRRCDTVGTAPRVEGHTSRNTDSIGAQGEMSAPPIGRAVFVILTRGDDLAADMAQVNLP